MHVLLQLNCTAIVYACEDGSIDLVKWLIGVGATMSVAVASPCLFEAASNGYHDIAKWLYSECGADPNWLTPVSC